MEERRQEIRNKEKDNAERQNVEDNNSTAVSDFLDLQALAI
jgi:hypothetical protein